MMESKNLITDCEVAMASDGDGMGGNVADCEVAMASGGDDMGGNVADCEVAMALGGADMGGNVDLTLLCSRVEELETRMSAVLERMGEIVEQLNGEIADSPQRQTISQQDYDSYVVGALKMANPMFGGSKHYIRKFLTSAHGIEDSKYNRRRLNACLKRKIESKTIIAEGELFRLSLE